MKLIREEVEAVEVLCEEVKGKKTFYIQGPFLQGDIKNRNGRIYESHILAKEVKRYNESYINEEPCHGRAGTSRRSNG
jgi:hypothetical protein